MSLAAKFGYEVPEGVTKDSLFKTESRSSASKLIIPGYGFFRPKDGKNRIRILPSRDGRFIRKFFMHVTPEQVIDDKTFPNMWCPESLGAGECVICNQMRAERSNHDRDYMRQFYPVRSKFVTRLIDRSDEDRGVLVWLMPKSVATNLEMLLDQDGTLVNISHPDEGFDILFHRKGTHMYNIQYGAITLDSKGPSKLHENDDLAMRWLEEVLQNRPSITDILVSPDKEAQESYLNRIKELIEGDLDSHVEDKTLDDSVPF